MEAKELGNKDLNLDNTSQSRRCCHYTIPHHLQETLEPFSFFRSEVFVLATVFIIHEVLDFVNTFFKKLSDDFDAFSLDKTV